MGKPKKQKYTVVMPVTQASGARTYEVEAESPEEAKRLVNTGEIECQCEELEVERVAPLEDWDVFDEKGKRA